MMYKRVMVFLFGILLISLVSADTNISDIEMRTTGNITADYFIGNGSQLTDINVSNINFNATQMENSGGVLNILETWFSSLFDTLFGAKTTDDLTEGTTNKYDNQSWNETKSKEIHYTKTESDNLIDSVNSSSLSINTTANIQNLLNSTGIYSTYNATYAGYATNVSINYTQQTYNAYNADWSSTYNSTYAGYATTLNETTLALSINTTANIQNLLNSTGIYSIPLTINTTANIQNLLNDTGIYSTYNATYDNYKDNVSRNWTEQANTYTDSVNTTTTNWINSIFVKLSDIVSLVGNFSAYKDNLAFINQSNVFAENQNFSKNITLNGGSINLEDNATITRSGTNTSTWISETGNLITRF